MARSALLNVMTNTALKAGRALSRDFGEVQNLQVSRKGTGDFVTNADLRAEKIIREELLDARPDIGFPDGRGWGDQRQGSPEQMDCGPSGMEQSTSCMVTRILRSRLPLKEKVRL